MSLSACTHSMPGSDEWISRSLPLDMTKLHSRGFAANICLHKTRGIGSFKSVYLPVGRSLKTLWMCFAKFGEGFSCYWAQSAAWNLDFCAFIAFGFQIRVETQLFIEIWLFSAVVFLPSVLWHCWLGIRKSIWPIKNWVMRCWCGYYILRDLYTMQNVYWSHAYVCLSVATFPHYCMEVGGMVGVPPTCAVLSGFAMTTCKYVSL